MIRGTRIFPAKEFNAVVDVCRRMTSDYEELVIPSIWEQSTFVDKAGTEVLGQMYAFQDKGGRNICLIPEVTAVVREIYLSSWVKERPKPVRVSYLSRCYRYERPQAGRYREFWQFGVEYLGGDLQQGREEQQSLLQSIFDALNIPVEYDWSVRRGLDYYVEDGFEVRCERLGAQKQVAGGGRYDCGVGFAIGIDRVMLAKELCDQ